MLEKGRAFGAHQLSGAVVEPGPLRDLLPDVPLDELTSYGEVRREAVYFLTGRAGRCASRPRRRSTTRATTSSRCRGSCARLAEKAEELGVMLLPETDAQRLLVQDGARARRAHGRQGPRPRRPGAVDFEPGRRDHRPGDGAVRGRPGRATDAAAVALRAHRRQPPGLRARREGDLEGAEAAQPRDPHAGVAATRAREASASSAAPSSTRWATTSSASASSSGSTTADATLSVHDLLQGFKTHPLIRRLLEGGERVAWGAKAIPEGGFWSLPAAVRRCRAR